MVKSNNGIKTGFMMVSSRFLCPQGVKDAFLIMELLIAISVGMVLISALMRMQSNIFELHESFDVRDKALGLAVNFYEQASNNQAGRQNFGIKVGHREFFLNILGVDKTQSFKKIRVEWVSSISGRRCSLEL